MELFLRSVNTGLLEFREKVCIRRCGKSSICAALEVACTIGLTVFCLVGLFGEPPAVYVEDCVTKSICVDTVAFPDRYGTVMNTKLGTNLSDGIAASAVPKLDLPRTRVRSGRFP
jgi:hypothetical protein